MHARTPSSSPPTLRRFGRDQNMVDLRLILAADCPKVVANKFGDLCGAIYPDLAGR